MKRLFILLLVLALPTALIVSNGSPASAQQAKSAFKVEDPMGVVKVKPGEPVHIACWFVVAGPDASLEQIPSVASKSPSKTRAVKFSGFASSLPFKTQAVMPKGSGGCDQTCGRPDDCRSDRLELFKRSSSGCAHPMEGRYPYCLPLQYRAISNRPKRGPEYEGYLRTAHNDRIQGAVAAQFAFKQLKLKKAATIHDGSPYAEQLQAVFVETFKKLGGTITSQEAVAPYRYGYAARSNQDRHRKARIHLLSRLYCSGWPHHTPGERGEGAGEGSPDGCGRNILPGLL